MAEALPLLLPCGRCVLLEVFVLELSSMRAEEEKHVRFRYCFVLVLLFLLPAFRGFRATKVKFLVLTYRIRQLGICRSAPKPSSRDKSTENKCSGLVSLRHLFTMAPVL